jgi:hypothetical protein
MNAKAVETVVTGLWICFVSLASAYAGAYLKTHPAIFMAEDKEKKLSMRKVKPMTVPIVSGGALKGYISAEFSFLQDLDGHRRNGLDPESYFMDEAFRLIYSDDSIDFANIEKIDLSLLAKKITGRVNERMGAPIVKETLVKNFAFVPKEDAPH